MLLTLVLALTSGGCGIGHPAAFVTVRQLRAAQHLHAVCLQRYCLGHWGVPCTPSPMRPSLPSVSPSVSFTANIRIFADARRARVRRQDRVQPAHKEWEDGGCSRTEAGGASPQVGAVAVSVIERFLGAVTVSGLCGWFLEAGVFSGAVSGVSSWGLSCGLILCAIPGIGLCERFLWAVTGL